MVLSRRRSSASGCDLSGSKARAELPCTTILFIPLSAPQRKLETDWDKDCDKLMRQCPICKRDSIIGHGCRRKQAHDEHHDWIRVHRGRCLGCGKTFTFLPLLSLPYTHYSLLARVQALGRRFREQCSWEQATPTLKDLNRLPDPSTLRRWAHDLDSSQPALSLLQQILARMTHGWPCDQCDQEVRLRSWLAPVLPILGPLRL
jgi:Domain of unknown function (DUF6431)